MSFTSSCCYCGDRVNGLKDMGSLSLWMHNGAALMLAHATEWHLDQWLPTLQVEMKWLVPDYVSMGEQLQV